MEAEGESAAAALAAEASATTPMVELLKSVSISSSSETMDPLSCPDLAALCDLASRGQWRTLLDHLITSATKSLPDPIPHHHLIRLSFRALSLTKLCRFSNADSLLESDPELSSDLSSPTSLLPSPRYLYESYPELYPSLHGSMIPFALRFLNADLPHRLGRRCDSLDRLYSLLHFVHLKLRSSPLPSWHKRESFVASSIVNLHLRSKEIDPSLALIRSLLSPHPSDPILLSKLGYIRLQIGDLDGARSAFSRLESSTAADHPETKNLVSRNRALLYLVAKDCVSAVREYEECIETDERDAAAINNKALCLIHLRDLSGSIKVLEGALERVPTAALNETLIINLCSMYELAFVNHADIKRSHSNWIAESPPMISTPLACVFEVPCSL